MNGPKYAKNGSVHIAYDVMGEGPIDLLFLPDGLIPIGLMTEFPPYDRYLRRLASFSRVIRYDRRGLGFSDPITPSTPPTLEQWMEDGRAVMDAAESQKAAVLGAAEGGFVSTVLAASHPERVSALVLVNATPGLASPPFSGLGTAPAALAKLALSTNENWGTDSSGIPLFAPSNARDEQFHEWLARSGRTAASPAVVNAIFKTLYYSDITYILPSVRVPTLVIHRAGNRYLTTDHGRFLSEHIPHARYVEVPGDDHVPYLGDSDAIVDEVEEFLTGVRHGPEADRRLLTLMFVDMVESTARAAAISDRGWRDLLERFRPLVHLELKRFNGSEVDWAGDGLLATFDGPARAIKCARAIVKSARSIGVPVRVGLHTGECELLGRGVAGIAVHTAARVMGEAASEEVLVSRTVRDLVAGAGISFAERGSHQLKGIPGEWELYAVEDDRVPV